MREHAQMIGGEERVADAADLQQSLTEIARCLNELTNQLHGATPDGAPAGVEETRPLMKALNAQFGGEGAEAWARALAETASDEEIDDSLAQGNGALNHRNGDFTQNSAALTQNDGTVMPDIGAPPNCGGGQDFAHRLRSHNEEPLTNVAEFKRVMDRAVAATQSGWQARLDADLATATEVWNERIKSSIENSAQRAAELVTLTSQQTAHQHEQAIAERIAAMSKSFMDAGAEAEKQLASVRVSFESEIKRAQDVLAQVDSSATAVDDQAARLASITGIAQEELKRRGSSMLEWHSEQLVQNARRSINEWNERLQAALETAGQRIVSKLGVEFEQQLNSRLDRTRGILDRLENEGRAVENLLRAHQIRMESFSDQAVENVLGRLEKVGTEWESKIEDMGRAATNKWIADMSSQATHSAPAARQPGSVGNQTVEIRPKEMGITSATIEMPPSLGKDRRGIRRLKMARPLLVRPEDPTYKEAVETTRNASRFGVYFTTSAKHYYPGMHLRVTLGYSPNDPCNVASFGKVLRLDPQENGEWGIAVRILLR